MARTHLLDRLGLTGSVLGYRLPQETEKLLTEAIRSKKLGLVIDHSVMAERAGDAGRRDMLSLSADAVKVIDPLITLLLLGDIFADLPIALVTGNAYAYLHELAISSLKDRLAAIQSEAVIQHVLTYTLDGASRETHDQHGQVQEAARDEYVAPHIIPPEDSMILDTTFDNVFHYLLEAGVFSRKAIDLRTTGVGFLRRTVRWPIFEFRGPAREKCVQNAIVGINPTVRGLALALALKRFASINSIGQKYKFARAGGTTINVAQVERDYAVRDFAKQQELSLVLYLGDETFSRYEHNALFNQFSADPLRDVGRDLRVAHKVPNAFVVALDEDQAEVAETNNVRKGKKEATVIASTYNWLLYLVFKVMQEKLSGQELGDGVKDQIIQALVHGNTRRHFVEVPLS